MIDEQDVQEAASIVAAYLAADDLHRVHSTFLQYVKKPMDGLAGIGDENWMIVLGKLKDLAESIEPERRYYETCIDVLEDAAQEGLEATKGVG